MARSIAAGGLRKTNTKYLLLALVLATLSAVLAYAAISRQTGGEGTSAKPTVTVVVAKEAIPAWTKITAAMLEEQTVPVDVRAEGAYSNVSGVVGSLARYPVARGEQVLPSKLAGTTSKTHQGVLAYAVPQGKRAMAISVSKVVGAGGLILPGDYVDVILDYPKDGPFLSIILLQNVEVTAVEQSVIALAPEGTPTPGAGNQRTRITDAVADPGAGVVTLLLTAEQAQKMFLAEQNGTIRLAVRGFGDGEETSDTELNILDIVPKQYIPADALPPGIIP